MPKLNWYDILNIIIGPSLNEFWLTFHVLLRKSRLITFRSVVMPAQIIGASLIRTTPFPYIACIITFFFTIQTIDARAIMMY